MKSTRSSNGATTSVTGARLDRRGLVIGAGVAAGAAIAAVVAHRRSVDPAPVAAAKPAPAQPDGYRETEHVLRYYQTTRS
jgi:hypothetical protein